MRSPRSSCSPAQLDTLGGRALCAQDLADTLKCSPRLHSDISALSWRIAAGHKALHDVLSRKMGRLAAKRCGARASGATEFVAFVTSQYLPDASGGLGVCGPFVCSLVQWAQQVHRLASGVQALAGEPASVHLFTPCLPPSMADTLSDGGRGARVASCTGSMPRACMQWRCSGSRVNCAFGLALKRRRRVATTASHLVPSKAVPPHF